MLSHVRLFATPSTVARQASLFMEFSRQEYWSELLFPTPGIESTYLVSPALVARFFTSGTTWEAQYEKLTKLLWLKEDIGVRWRVGSWNPIFSASLHPSGLRR